MKARREGEDQLDVGTHVLVRLRVARRRNAVWSSPPSLNHRGRASSGRYSPGDGSNPLPVTDSTGTATRGPIRAAAGAILLSRLLFYGHASVAVKRNYPAAPQIFARQQPKILFFSSATAYFKGQRRSGVIRLPRRRAAG